MDKPVIYSKSFFLKKYLSISSVSLLFLFATWFFLVSWRVVYFGFYHDDWSSVALPLDRSSDLISLIKSDPSRPLYVIIIYLLRPLLNSHTEMWQLLLALVHLLSALAIRSTASLLFAENGSKEGKVIGSVAGILWLVFPWSLGYSAWAIMLPPNLAMLLSICAFLVLLKPGLDLRKINLSVILMAISWLIYEATWMFWLPFALVLFARSINKNESIGYAFQFFIRAFVVQVLFIVWNRYVSAASSSGKKLSENFISLLQADWALFFSQLLPLLIAKEFIGTSLVLLLACIFFNKNQWKKSSLNWVNPIFMLIGLSASVGIYALAGYAIDWTGLFSRTSLPISFWLVLLFSGIFAMAWKGSKLIVKKVLIISLIGFMLPLGISLIKQSILWKKSWQEQREIIDILPQSVVDLANQNTLILFDIPRGTGPVFTFSAYWDISGVVMSRMPNYTKPDKPHAYASVMRGGDWRTTWDGKILRQYWCSNPNSPIWSLEASRVYLWKYPKKEASEVVAPFEFGCF